MRRGAWGAIIGVSLVIAIVAGGLGYPISERDHRPADQRFEFPDDHSYQLTASIVVEGESVLAVEGVQTSSGERYTSITESDAVVERYQSGRNATIYSRYVVPAQHADRRERELREASDEMVAVTESDSQRRVIVTERPADHGGQWDVRKPASVVTTELRLAAYDPVDSTNTGDRRVLEPQPGWYDGSRSYRLTDVNGTVAVAADSDVLHEATVRWDETHGTRSYLHYLANRRSTITKELSVEYRDEGRDIQTPEWVSRAVNESEA